MPYSNVSEFNPSDPNMSQANERYPNEYSADPLRESPSDRRRHQRFLAHFEARVTDLRTGRAVSGNVVDFSQAGICVVAPLQLPTEDPANNQVQLEIADSVLVGHAVYSTAEGEYFRSGIAVEQVWLGGTEQGLNLQVVLLQAMPATPGVLAADAYLG
jgi:hypothetical protein